MSKERKIVKKKKDIARPKTTNIFRTGLAVDFAAHAIYMSLQSVNPGVSSEFSLLMRPGSETSSC